MSVFDPTPIIVATVSAAGAVGAAYYAFRSGQKTTKKIETMPTDLVKEFGRLNPGVDTVEKVIELLYAEITRLSEEKEKSEKAYAEKIKQLNEKVDKLLSEKQELLDEISKMKTALDQQRRKLTYLETRIKKSLGTPEVDKE
jgi:predicted RNase H-like nuclease (RuvC/YqgF family)